MNFYVVCIVIKVIIGFDRFLVGISFYVWLLLSFPTGKACEISFYVYEPCKVSCITWG